MPSSPFIKTVSLVSMAAILASCSPKLTIRENEPQRLFQEANNCYYQGEFKAAEEKYLSSLRLREDAAVLACLAVLYKDLGNFSQAADYFERALKIKKDNFRELNLGLCRFHNGEYDSAIRVFKELLEKKEPCEPAVKLYAGFGLGASYEALKRFAEAALQYGEILKERPDFATANYKLGDVYSALNEDAKALPCYQSALGQDSSLYKAYFKIAVIFEKQERYSQSLENFRVLSLIEPDNKLVRDKIKELTAKTAVRVKKEEELREAARKASKCLTVEPIKEEQTEPAVRVSILKGVNLLRLKCGAKFSVFVKGKEVAEVPAEEAVRIETDGGISIKDSNNKLVYQQAAAKDGVISLQCRDRKSTFTVFDVTLNKGYFWAKNQDRGFRGSLELSSSGRALNIVNIVLLDEYLFSVVPSEIAAFSNPEALKAQAVVARSYVYEKIKEKTHENADICSDVHCQAYNGVFNEHKNTTVAVEATRGEMIYCEGKVISAYFFSACGGHTRNVEDVWT
ncbi:MAG: SpoIID/LytB domain-containing protein, partial [Candidatus Firestonebacteria bacterium]